MVKSAQFNCNLLSHYNSLWLPYSPVRTYHTTLEPKTKLYIKVQVHQILTVSLKLQVRCIIQVPLISSTSRQWNRSIQSKKPIQPHSRLYRDEEVEDSSSLADLSAKRTMMQTKARVRISHTISRMQDVPSGYNSITEDYSQEVIENKLIDYTFTTQVPNYFSKQCIANPPIAGLKSIQPVATQIPSVADSDAQPLHIELDSVATISYITLAEARNCHYTIKPNSQVSHLGDSLTPLKLYGDRGHSLQK